MNDPTKCTRCTLAQTASVHESMVQGRQKSPHMWHPFEHNPVDLARHRATRTASYARIEQRGFEDGWRVAVSAAAHIAQRAGAGEIASEIVRLLANSEPTPDNAPVMRPDRSLIEPTACGRPECLACQDGKPRKCLRFIPRVRQ